MSFISRGRITWDGPTLTERTVTMTGVSNTLVAADPTRSVVCVSSADENSPAAINPVGTTCALSGGGIALAGGQFLEITGRAAQSAMTQIGTNGQLLYVLEG